MCTKFVCLIKCLNGNSDHQSKNKKTKYRMEISCGSIKISEKNTSERKVNGKK